jgi:membrane-associated protease RseP (regulator of RpoE activity)
MTLYRSFRDEMMAGGAVNDGGDNPKAKSLRSRGIVSGLVVTALLVWLGVSNIWSLVLVIGLLVSIFLHEVGHFVTAGWAGMKRTQFFMGFGPKLWSTHRNGVEYGVRALPLGAFVRIVGMNNLDPVEPGDENLAYSSKPYRWRLLVITAGSIMHIIIAVTIMLFVYGVGGRFQETGRTEVISIGEGTPAEIAGLVPGDVVLAVNGDSIESSDDLRSTIGSLTAGRDIIVTVDRSGSEIDLGARLAPRPTDPEGTSGYLGVSTDSFGREQLGFLDATGHVIGDLWTGMGRTLEGIVTVLNPVNQWEQVTDSNADPTKRPTTVVGITQVAGDIGDRDGMFAVLEVLASINVFVGLFNMLPLLPFDGGHAAVATYERIRSRKDREYRADVEKLWPLTVAVVTALLFLTVAGLYLDITRPF